MSNTYTTPPLGHKPRPVVRPEASWTTRDFTALKFHGRRVSVYADKKGGLWLAAGELAGTLPDAMIRRAVYSAIRMLETEPVRAEEFGIAFCVEDGSALLSVTAGRVLTNCAELSVGGRIRSLFERFAFDISRRARRRKLNPTIEWLDVPDALDRAWRSEIAAEWRGCHYIMGDA